MTVTTIPAAGTAPTSQLSSTSPTDSSAAATKDLSQNYSTFLQLLTTQLKNQDPLNPMDSSQFTSQLVQFSSVEQAIKQNTNLQTLIDAQTANTATNSVNYIGRTVAATSDQVALAQGSATINYALNSDVASDVITISDSTGRTIRSLTGLTTQGAHSISWDGKDANGAPVADGTYKIAISAANADQTQAGATIGISGVVTGVSLIDNKPVLAIGGVSVPVANILSVSGTSGSAL